MARALVKRPSQNFARGLTSQSLGVPKLELAREQHKAYLTALRSLGLELLCLKADEHPDSCFVEDMALIVQNVGDPSKGAIVLSKSIVRAAERPPVETALRQALPDYVVTGFESPAQLEGGDVLRLGSHFFVGITERTNRAGFLQFQSLVESYGYLAHAVEVEEMLHLKTGASPLPGNTILSLPRLARTFRELGCQVIEVDPDESYAANTVAYGHGVLVPSGRPHVLNNLQRLGLTTIEINLSEFEKQDGGASCLSILLP